MNKQGNFNAICHGRNTIFLSLATPLVDISPREDRPRTLKIVMDDGASLPCATGYPIYRRDHMKTDRAPMKTVERYVAPRVV